jgi:hypothetical protein
VSFDDEYGFEFKIAKKSVILHPTSMFAKFHAVLDPSLPQKISVTNSGLESVTNSGLEKKIWVLFSNCKFEFLIAN